MEVQRDVYDPLRQVYADWQNSKLPASEFLNILAMVYPPDQFDHVIRQLGIQHPENGIQNLHNPDQQGPDHFGDPLPPFGGGSK